MATGRPWYVMGPTVIIHADNSKDTIFVQAKA